ncbi:WD40 repeat domain-containing protein [Streptomyces sp. SID13031]|uniref:NACHT and WD repeat domain-containing protein n=1 Tax=Streptomyces sp. SID13031 TaxID=2706046 RepID=UPI00194521CC|nr:WD40 repeat domain-containing protein [Streptomyces sp. SID13031]
MRDQSGLSVRDLSSRLGQHRTHGTSAGWLAGRNIPSVASLDLFVGLLRACGVADELRIDAWLTAWRLVNRTPGRRDGAEPYRGLASFQPSDADWYFGREMLTERVVNQITRLHAGGGGLQIVVGASGAGKSSMLRAGVVPALTSRRAPGRPGWSVVLMTPGEQPVETLGAVLAGDEGVLSAEGDDRLLIVVDQFEELFTACPDEGARLSFIQALAAAAHEPPSRAADRTGRGGPATVVLIGLRADFYPHALRYPELAQLLQDAQFVVGPLGPDDLRRAIVEPAHKANVGIDDGLVELLLRDIAPETGRQPGQASPPGALPLLSHALLATWRRSPRGQMTVGGYLTSGGIAGAVARTADEAYEELSPLQQDVARRIFVRLVNLGEDTADTRRKVARSELLASGDRQVELVVEQFVERRLLTADAGTIEISHEALLDAWPLLHGWIDSDREGLRHRRRLADAAANWRDLGREPAALYGGSRLDAVRGWVTEVGRDLSPQEREYLEASLQKEQFERTVARRRTRRLLRLVAALTVLSLVAGGLAGYSYWKRNSVNHERDLAVSRQVAITANRLQATDPGLAARLSLAAYRIAPTLEARSSLIDSTGGPPVTRIVRPARGPQNVTVTPDGRTLIGAGAGPSDTAVLLWDISDPRHPVRLGEPLTDHSKEVFALAVSPDGRLLATGGRDHTIQLWNISDPAAPVRLGMLPGGTEGTVYSLAFSPDGQVLAAGNSDRTVRLWKVTDKGPMGAPGVLAKALDSVNSVAFSGDGRLLVAVDTAGLMQVWELGPGRDPRAVARVRTGTTKLTAVAFAPGRKVVVIGGLKGLLKLYDLSRPGQPVPVATSITPPGNWVNSIAFSPDGKLLGIGSSDDVAQVWGFPAGDLVATLPHTEPVSTVRFLHSGRTLVTSGSDGTARLWTIPGPVMTGAKETVASAAIASDGRRLMAAGGGISLWDVSDPGAPLAIAAGLTAADIGETVGGAAALRPDGKLLAAGTTGTSVFLWTLDDWRKPVRLKSRLTGPGAIVESLVFSPDGKLLAAGSDDGKVWLWDLGDPRRPLALGVAPGSGTSNYVYMVAFSPDGRTLAAVTADGVVQLWDMSDSRRIHTITTFKGSADLLYSVGFSLDSKVLATGSADGTVSLWSVADASKAVRFGAPLTGPDGTVSSVVFGPDGRTLAATTRGGQVWFWDVADPGKPRAVAILSASTAAVWAVAFSPDGHTVATGGTDRTVRLWETDPEQAAALVCSTGGDGITQEEWRKYAPGVAYRSVC